MPAVGMPQAAYALQFAWGKQAGVTDIAPFWTSHPWTGGANAPFNTYVDLTSYSTARPVGIDFNQAVQITRGKQQVLGPVASGTLTVQLRDPTGILDPLNTSSPLNGKVVPYIGVVFGATLSGTWYPRFMGFVTRWHREKDRPGTVTVTAQDLLHRMNRFKNIGIISGVAISHTADALTWAMGKIPWAYTDFATGIGIDSSTGLQNNFSASDSMLSFVQGVVDPSLGTFYIGVDGTTVFVARGSAHRGVQATITNTMTQVPSEADIDLLYNQAMATMTRPGQANFTPRPQTVNDATSKAQYGPATWELSSPWWVSDTDALAAASFVVSKYKTPMNRMRQVTVMGRTTNDLTAILAVDVGDTVTITEAKDGTTGNYVVWGIAETVDKTRHSAVWTLAPGGY